MNQRIAVIGAGPAGLFVFKRLIESERKNLNIIILEASERLGSGMPYSPSGANQEHVTNVSGNEIPMLVTGVMEWMQTLGSGHLEKYGIDPARFSDYQVLPRLLFGEYLSAQFHLLLERAEVSGISVTVRSKTRVTDIISSPSQKIITLEINGSEKIEVDSAVVCTGHVWPDIHEHEAAGYFDSPYPPEKISRRFNHPVALRGSSLTAIDAVRTLARYNGAFITTDAGEILYEPDEESPKFRIVMHSRHGLLPCIRFHLTDPHLSKSLILSHEEIDRHRNENGGFVSLDYIFENDFKEPVRQKDPIFYERIRNMNLESFVDTMMLLREDVEPFAFFKGEYTQAQKSIDRKQSVYWKEALAILSFAMNYPARYFSAEDMLRLQKTLMPLISIVIAFVPQQACLELLALHEAGRLEIIAVGDKNEISIDPEGGITFSYTDTDTDIVSTRYHTFIDCTGQRHLSVKEFPFRTLVHNKQVEPASIAFRSAEIALALQKEKEHAVEKEKDGKYYLSVPGINITDHFRLQANDHSIQKLYVMSVPFIGGFNPDYSGLDFCEAASKVIVNDLLNGNLFA